MCSELVGENETTLLSQVIGQRARELRSRRDKELMKKFQKLSSVGQDDNDVPVHNLSSTEFKPEQIQVLKHAAGFNISDADPVNLVTTIESVLKHSQEPAETQYLIRQQVTSLQDALRLLKADKSIVILPADKGRSTVILGKAEYLQKANALLEDRQAYVKCDGDPMKKLVTQINTTLTMLQNNGAVTRAERLATKPTDVAMARFYGLPKIHKDGAPLRPIVSLRGTPTFNLAKWMFRRLNCLTSGSDTTVRSSVHFLERLKGLQINTAEVMVSFDVTSIFTSIPKDLAVETVSDLLGSQYTESNNTPRRGHLVQLLKYCLQTFFTFEGTVYEQIKGTPLGSPLSGFIAETVLQKLETLVFARYKPKFWARYVDDTFVVLKRDIVSNFHALLNSVLPDIQFTIETENNNQIAFLDVLVHRKVNGSLKTTVYGKATNTLQVLSYHSNHPLCHKRSCVRSLYKRVDTHCSEPADKVAELHYLRRMFTSNGYPRSFIERSRLSRLTIKSTTNQLKVWRALPYIANDFEVVARILQPLDIGMAHKPEATIRRLVMMPKTPMPRGETANVIYRIPCSSCEANYVGETGKRLQTRMDEHARAVRRMDQLSLVAEHCAAFGHAFAFQDAEVLGQWSDQTVRETLEAWHTTTTSINRCVTLPAAYQALRVKFNRQGYRRDVWPETTNAKILGRGNDRVAREMTEAWDTEATTINRCVAIPTARQALQMQFNELKSKREVRTDVNPNTGEPTTDLHVTTPKIGLDEGAVINTVASTTTPADGEKSGQRDAIKTSNPARQLRSTRMRAMATNVQMPPSNERQAD
nr:unnamed protein product [Spirometra erinaceieuropaei]